MYTIPFGGNVRLQTNEGLREYARLEYQSKDFHWLLAGAKKERKSPRTTRRLHQVLRRPRPAPGPVACKGSPRRGPEEAPSPV